MNPTPTLEEIELTKSLKEFSSSTIEAYSRILDVPNGLMDSNLSLRLFESFRVAVISIQITN